MPALLPEGSRDRIRAAPGIFPMRRPGPPSTGKGPWAWPSHPRPPRARYFAPVFGGSDQPLGVSDAEREVVADRLAGPFADGGLDQLEFDERAGRAMSAKTRADLAG